MTHNHLFAVEPFAQNMVNGKKWVWRFCIKCREDLFGREETIRRALEAGKLLREWDMERIREYRKVG